jgi:predicted transcriptional regulator
MSKSNSNLPKKMIKDKLHLYYNSTNLKGIELSEAIIKGQSQDVKVLLYFLKNPEEKLSRYQVLEKLIMLGLLHPNTQASSIGRALNSLMKDGCITKLDESIIERYGCKNYLWQLTPGKEYSFL